MSIWERIRLAGQRLLAPTPAQLHAADTPRYAKRARRRMAAAGGPPQLIVFYRRRQGAEPAAFVVPDEAPLRSFKAAWGTPRSARTPQTAQHALGRLLGEEVAESHWGRFTEQVLERVSHRGGFLWRSEVERWRREVDRGGRLRLGADGTSDAGATSDGALGAYLREEFAWPADGCLAIPVYLLVLMIASIIRPLLAFFRLLSSAWRAENGPETPIDLLLKSLGYRRLRAEQRAHLGRIAEEIADAYGRPKQESALLKALPPYDAIRRKPPWLRPYPVESLRFEMESIAAERWADVVHPAPSD